MQNVFPQPTPPNIQIPFCFCDEDEDGETDFFVAEDDDVDDFEGEKKLSKEDNGLLLSVLLVDSSSEVLEPADDDEYPFKT